jgi:hypothetical protein
VYFAFRVTQQILTSDVTAFCNTLLKILEMAIATELQSRGGEDRVWSHSDWEETKAKARYKKERMQGSNIPFSAFWLRSSVVSVLISLISDTRLIEPHDINLVFPRVRVHLAACWQNSRASPWYCTTSLAGATLLQRGSQQAKIAYRQEY